MLRVCGLNVRSRGENPILLTLPQMPPTLILFVWGRVGWRKSINNMIRVGWVVTLENRVGAGWQNRVGEGTRLKFEPPNVLLAMHFHALFPLFWLYWAVLGPISIF